MTELAIGIDGGGSSCRAAVADRTGKILGRGTAGPANILSNLEGSLENIILSAKEALRDAALAPETVSSVSSCQICRSSLRQLSTVSVTSAP